MMAMQLIMADFEQPCLAYQLEDELILEGRRNVT
jgi:hypothetical protein